VSRQDRTIVEAPKCSIPTYIDNIHFEGYKPAVIRIRVEEDKVMFFNPVHLHWWIIGGMGAALLFLPFIIDGLDFDFDMDVDAGDVFAPAGIVAFLLGNPKVPMLFLIGTYFLSLGALGWVVFALLFEAVGTMPSGFSASFLTIAIAICARHPAMWLCRAFAPLMNTTSMDTSDERLIFALATVVTVAQRSEIVPKLSSGTFGEVQINDQTIKTVRAVVEDGASYELRKGDTVRIIDQAVTPRGVPVFVVEAY
jgi:hypothetical protein